MKLDFKYLLIVICTLLNSDFLEAQAHYYFKQISVREGLSQSTVRATYYDSKGFLWIGTGSGLNRFDTHDLKSYQNNENKPSELPSNLIHFILEDKENKLWVGTELGVAIYNHTADEFETIKLDNGDPALLRTGYLTPTGVLFGGIGGLYLYTYEQGELKPLPLSFPDQEILRDAVQFIAPLDKDNYYIGTRRDGLWIYSLEDSSLRRADFSPYREIVAYHVDGLGQLWISPYGEGAVVYNTKGDKVRNYTTENSKLSSNIILDIADRHNEVWLATDGAGISIINQESDSISVINHIAGDVNSFPVSSIYSLYCDGNDNMWAGSIRGGLISIKEVYMKSYGDVVPHNKQGLSEKTVLSLYEDRSGLIWMGTDGGGLNRLNPLTGEFIHYESTMPYKVVSITEYDSSNLLLSLFGKGLYLFNKRSKEMKLLNLLCEETRDRMFYSGSSVNVSAVESDSIYLFANQIYLHQPSLSQTESKLKNATGDRLVRSFLQIKSKYEPLLYLASTKELFSFDYRKGEVVDLLRVDGSERIQAIAEGEPGELWIGTNEGLYKFSVANQKLERIETKLFHEVTSLIYNAKNGLWIGAQSSLLSYQPNTGHFNLMGESNGASYNEYLAKPTLVSTSGTIYMGGVLGLLEIDSEIELSDKEEVLLSLSELRLDGVSSLKSVGEGKIDIPWNYSSLSLGLLPKEEDIFREKVYRYYIYGSDREVVESKSNSLTIYSLPIGSYEVFVSCTANDGSWLTPTPLLKIEITPPWWRSWWARLLSVGLILFTGCTLYLYSRRKSRQELILRKQNELQLRNEERIRFLINISHELRTPLTLIYAPLKRVLNSLSKEAEYYKELAGVLRQTREMRDLINMILDVRRVEIKDQDLSRDKILLSQFAQQLTEDFKTECEAKAIELVCHVKQDKLVVIDRSKCEMILSNYLMNALKFSDKESTIQLRIFTVDNSLRFEVIDEGIGLSEEDVQSVFTRFYQGDHLVKGSGIGLSYAKELVELLKGEIGAFNNSEKGATFWFTIPLVTVDVDDDELLSSAVLNQNEGVELEGKFSQVRAVNLKEYSLAIVEDDNDMRSFLNSLFHDQFKSVVCYENGRVALEGLKKSEVDLVLSDVMMPYMDGFELCRAIKQSILISHIPVVLLTARADSSSEHIGYKVGADAYLAKPFDPDLLFSLLRNILYTREQIKQRVHSSYPLLDPVEATFSPSDEKFVENLNTIIDKHIGNPKLDVTFITQEIGMSRASLYNKLKAIGGVGVNDYIISCRIHKACQMLLNKEFTIGEVSDLLGFNNQRYFSTVFKQVKGVTPSEFRKASQG